MSKIDIQYVSRLAQKVIWIKAPQNSDGITYAGESEGKTLALQINDFPDEHLFTLYIDGQAVLDFDDWPDQFGTKPWQDTLKITKS